MERFKDFITGYEKIVNIIANVTHVMASMLLAFMMFFTSVDVIVRAVYRPIRGGYEILSYSCALLIFFSLGYCQLKKGYTTVSFVTDKFPKKVQHVLELITYAISFILVVVLTWQMYIHANRIMYGGDLTVDLRVPVYLFVFAAFFGLTVFSLTLLLDLLKIVAGISENKDGGEII